jgi:predicted transcriptional regulator
MWHNRGMSLDQWMRENDVSNTELATHIGVSQPYIGRLRRGERGASLKVALSLSKRTKLPVAAFLKEVA